jgi:hypothetical protein
MEPETFEGPLANGKLAIQQMYNWHSMRMFRELTPGLSARLSASRPGVSSTKTRPDGQFIMFPELQIIFINLI